MGKCDADGCSNSATTLNCPTCLKNQLPPTYFCSQECFKKSWPTHKKVHPIKRTTATSYDPFPMFPYTGELRAVYPLSAYRKVPPHINRPDYADDDGGVPRSEQVRRGKLEVDVATPEHIAKVTKVCRLAREVLDIAAAAVRPGITTDEIDRIVHEAAVERNSYPSPLNYYGFPKSCCTSVNEVICHGIPDGYVLKDGDIVNVDVTLYHDGVHGDMNETFFVGKPDALSELLVKTTYECLKKAIEICKPGVLYRSVGDVIQKHAAANNFAVVRTYCGHGIGELFHTSPNIPHYSKNKAVGVMKTGHVFTIEPMINLGVFSDKTWPDNWTSVTTDGKRSAQFEHQLLITDDGCIVLSENKDGIPWFQKQLLSFSDEDTTTTI